MEVYAVRSQDGKWLRRKGYGGSGDNWVDEFDTARIYPKIGPARAQVTWWATNYPSFGVPEIVVFELTEKTTIDDTERLAKKRKKDEESGYRLRVDVASSNLERAKKEMEKAQKEFEEAITSP